MVLIADVATAASSRGGVGVGARAGLAAVLAIGTLLATSPRLGAQDHDHASAPASPLATTLTVVDAVGVTRIVTTDQLAALPRHHGRAEVHGHGWTWEGVDLRAALRLAGVATDSLRGPALSHVVVLVGADGYRATLTLADLDPSLGGRHAWLVDREDGAPLTPARLPRRVIVEGDQRASRWVTQLVRIEIVDVARR